MTFDYENPTYDFICLCCGARNGEQIPKCTLNEVFSSKSEGKRDFQSFALAVDAWIRSPKYKGSILVPEGYQMTEEERLALVEMTAAYKETHSGVLLFARPEIEDLPEHAIRISDFIH